MQEYINDAEKYILHTYNRYQVVFDHGDGVNLYAQKATGRTNGWSVRPH